MAKKRVSIRKISPEEQEKIELERSLEEIKELKYLPEPTRVFAVGDEAKYGNWDYCKILEVMEGGKYYLVYIETRNEAYGKYLGQKKSVVYRTWLDLKPKLNTSNVPSFIEDDDIQFNYYQQDINSLLHRRMHSSAGIDMDPPYQRHLVWTLDQKVDLIDSIFRNIDIGKFSIIRNSFDLERPFYYEILDGKQRMSALCDFFEGRFRYKGLLFWELCFRDQHHFTGFPVSIGEAQNLTEEQKLRYFLKLNVSGTPQDPEHIRKIHDLWQETREKKV
jgi:hypothetical protein